MWSIGVGLAVALALLGSAGCRQVFGLDDPIRIGPVDAPEGASDALHDASTDPDALADPKKVRALTVTADAVIQGPHADFPVLVMLDAQWLRHRAHGGDVAHADGFDIYFTANLSNAEILAHEVERYLPQTGSLIAWVRIPSLTQNTTIHLHYGDDSIEESQENPTAVWSAGYAGVMHLTTISDSTLKSSATALSVATVPGKIGDARSFNGTTSAIELGSAAAIDNLFVGGGSLEAWFYAETFGEASWGRILDKGPNGWALLVDSQNAPNTLTFSHAASITAGMWRQPNNSVSLGAWHHIAVVYNKGFQANVPTFIFDGVAMSTVTADSPAGSLRNDQDATLHIGNDESAARTFNGVLDEVRLSSVPRSSAWFATQYQNQADPAKFWIVSDPL